MTDRWDRTPHRARPGMAALERRGPMERVPSERQAGLLAADGTLVQHWRLAPAMAERTKVYLGVPPQADSASQAAARECSSTPAEWSPVLHRCLQSAGRSSW